MNQDLKYASAFPSDFAPGYIEPSPGMSYRQWLAGKALQGILSNSEWDEFPDGCAKTAVKFADALIAELEKGK